MITPISNSSVMRAQHMLSRNQNELFRTTTRLATGRRINSGRDDPAGLISSERLGAAIRVLEAETKSLRRADSFANISEGHASQVSGLLGELNGLVVASANQAGMTDGEIAANQMQIDAIVNNIERFGGDAVASLDRFTMPDDGNTEVAALVDGAMSAVSSLRSGGANSLASGNFEAAQTAVQGAIEDVAVARGRVGSYQKYSVESRVRSNQAAIENLSESRSRIADTDYAVESSNLARSTILNAASVMVLKIAQQQGNSILDLLA